MTVAAGPGVAPAPDRSRLALALLLGAIVALSLGVYGAVHDPTGRSLVTLFFTATINLKVWLATAAVVLAVFQVLTAAKFYGRLGRGHGPRWLGRVHRASGTLAFLLTIPVAYHCLWALGFDSAADAARGHPRPARVALLRRAGGEGAARSIARPPRLGAPARAAASSSPASSACG